MKRIILVVLLITAAVAGALVYFSLTRPAPRAADLLPDTSMVVLYTPDFARSRGEFRTTAAYALWREPEIQAFLAKPRQALRDALGKRANVEPDEKVVHRIIDALQGEIFLAVTHVRPLPVFQVGVIFGADVKAKRLEAAAALADLRNRFRKAYPDAKLDTIRYLGVPYTRWEPQPGFVVCQAMMKSLVVFTLGDDTMRDTIARFTGQVQSSMQPLATSEKFKNIVAHMPSDYECLAYVNVEQITAMLGPILSLNPRSAGVLEKLRRIQASGNSVTFTDGKVQGVAYLAHPGPGPSPPSATQRRTLALTSPQTLLYIVRSSDLLAAYDELIQSLGQTGNPELAAKPLELERNLRQRGIRIREDLLAHLGPETAVIASWPAHAPMPDVALVTELRDAAQIRPALDATLDALKELTLGSADQYPWEATQYGDVTLHTVRMGAGKIAPTYAVTGDFFILTLTAESMRALLDNARNAGPTLTANDHYAQAMRVLPQGGYAYAYCDLSAAFTPLYEIAKQAVAELPPNEYVETDKLPNSETITRHLTPFVLGAVADKHGETTTSFSPLGTPVIVIAAVAGGFVAARSLAFGPQGLNLPTPPTGSSGTVAPPPPPGNQKAASQTPPT